jgi:hypothetical protein
VKRIFNVAADILCLIPCVLMILFVFITVIIIDSIYCMRTYRAIDAALNCGDEAEYWQVNAW